MKILMKMPTPARVFAATLTLYVRSGNRKDNLTFVISASFTFLTAYGSGEYSVLCGPVEPFITTKQRSA